MRPIDDDDLAEWKERVITLGGDVGLGGYLLVLSSLVALTGFLLIAALLAYRATTL